MSINPWYNTNANYQTNAKSIVDYLARSNKFLEMVVEDYEVFQELIVAEMKQATFDAELAVDDILVKWLEDGTLERIINDGVLGNKADKTFVEAELEKVTTQLVQANTNVEAELEKVTTQLAQANTNIEVIKHKQSQYVSVTDFGAIGDGVTDDTVAVQRAIDSVGLSGRNSVLFFPPTNENEFLLSELTIVKGVVISFVGTEQTKLNFTSRVCFRVKTESIFFNKLNIRSTHIKAREEGSVMFLDDREYSTLDFDLKVENCHISNTFIVVKTKGRGVHLLANEYQEIPGRLISINVLPETSVVEGNEPIQTYTEGYRGYRIENSRLHYLTHPTLIEVEGEGTSIVQGVSIVNNWIEGGCVYFRGKVNNLIIKDNQHYHNNYPWSASTIDILGGSNIDIDLNISAVAVPPSRPIVSISGVSEQVIIRGSVNGFSHHVVSITADVTQLVVDIVVKGAQKNVNDWYPRMLDITNEITVNGFRLDGMYHGIDVETAPIYKEYQSTVTNFKNNLIATGSYQEMPIW